MSCNSRSLDCAIGMMLNPLSRRQCLCASQGPAFCRCETCLRGGQFEAVDKNASSAICRSNFVYIPPQQPECLLSLFILIDTYSFNMMPVLPPEIWTMIAKQVKRAPPPAGEAGNWNDHFHQQDLTSLMRVNQVSAVANESHPNSHL